MRPSPHHLLRCLLVAVLASCGDPAGLEGVSDDSREADADLTALPAGSLTPRVSRRLTELGVTIEREKKLDASRRSRVTSERIAANGTRTPLTDTQIADLVRQNRNAYIAREGAVGRKLSAKLKTAASAAPTTPLRIALLGKVDPSKLPPRPSVAEWAKLTKAQDDALTKARLAAMKAAVAPINAKLVEAARADGATNVRALSWAPIVYAEATPSRALALARRTDVVRQVLDATHRPTPELATSACAVGAPTVASRGISAGAVEVAVLEPDQVDHPLACLDVTAVLDDSSIERHPTGVAGIIGSTLAGTLGVAPGANIISTDIDWGLSDAADIADGLEWALDHGADVYNMSFGTDDSGEMELEDVAVDWFVRHMFRTVVKSAGNIGKTCDTEVTSPGNAYNAITVGNYDDMGTCGTTDDVISSGSCYGDPQSPHGDRQKPEVAAPGTNITTLDWSGSSTCATRTGTGTSFSAPHVSGSAALLIARNSGIKVWPELIKALLMATAFNNVEGDERLSEKDGVGGIDVAAADDALSKGRWRADTYDFTDLDANGEKVLAHIEVKPLTSRLKISLNWDSNPSNEGLIDPEEQGLANDLDLFLEKSDGTASWFSASFDNNYETLDIANPPAGLYILKMKAYGNVGLPALAIPEYVGVAWGLVEHKCVDLGGDVDGDDVCGNTDNCRYEPNADQTDTDGDGDGNACDNCWMEDNADQKDTDLDGQGDVCDDDLDNDGCENGNDEDSDDAWVQTGTWSGTYCTPHSGATYGFDGEDSDNDGILNCEDPDDDDDGLDDDEDGCPTLAAGTGPITGCHEIKVCAGNIWWDACMMGGCVEVLMKIVSVVNPDPTRELIFDNVQIENGAIYASPIANLSVAQSLEQVGGEQVTVGWKTEGPTAQKGLTIAPGLRRIELWTRGTKAVPAKRLRIVGEYDPAKVTLGGLTDGKVLYFRPGASGQPLYISGAWGSRVEPTTSLRDSDRDGVPDAFDNCPRAANRAQDDRDRDGVGDVCDSSDRLTRR